LRADPREHLELFLHSFEKTTNCLFSALHAKQDQFSLKSRSSFKSVVIVIVVVNAIAFSSELLITIDCKFVTYKQFIVVVAVVVMNATAFLLCNWLPLTTNLLHITCYIQFVTYYMLHTICCCCYECSCFILNCYWPPLTTNLLIT